MTTNKHIALWTCPRSRSTLITRAFEQLDGCLVFDEPFYAPYLLKHGFNHPHRQEIIESSESNYEKVIQQITGSLPNNASFSFQKHIAKHALPEFSRDWLKSLHNVFLIRDPKEIVLSWYKVLGSVTFHDIGIADLYTIFQDVKALTGHSPLVIDSTEFVRNPKDILKRLCAKLEVTFSEKMLSWEPELKDSNLSLSSFAPSWYSTVRNSSGFLPYEEKAINIPDDLIPIVEDCLPFSEKLYQEV
ncbi:MAG: hypothetical protein F6K26_04050 [Moorea sp. SIO2I5]|nr:hypothetical protein [Moorena sp. SIO2I5]